MFDKMLHSGFACISRLPLHSLTSSIVVVGYRCLFLVSVPKAYRKATMDGM